MDKLDHDGTIPTIKFIPDVASNEDFFGGHKNVARTMGEVLRTNANVKVVGLLGPWGSGKSTVVRLLSSYLKSESNSLDLVFEYDAWLHQSDPPRRAFLETLLHYLIEQGLTREDSWSEKLDVLNRRVEDSVTTTTPRLTVPGTVMTLSLLLIPFGLKFASLDWYKAFRNDSVPNAGWFFFGGIGLIGVPVLLALVFYLAWRPTLKFWTSDFWQAWNWNRNKKPHQDESILSLFMNRETKTNFNRVTKDPEPTAIEFQDAFREAMEIATASKRRFVIVIDNLDRLPESEAIALWATIRSFFLGSDGGLRSRRGLHQPVVILPMAQDAIERLYSPNSDSTHSLLARSFMEKTFDLTFYVSRPVLTQWNEFLARQMASVFGSNYEDAWAFAAGRFYERYSAQDGSPTITPRGINTLINAIATRWLQWKEVIRFETIAYYCIFRDSIEEDIIQAVSTPLAPIGEYDPQWQNSIAALYYGVKPEDAAQVLLNQPLRKAIQERNVDDFRTLSLIPSFDLELHKIIEGNKESVDATVLFNAAFLASEVGLDQKLVAVRQIWSLMRGTLSSISRLKSFGDVESIGLLEMFRSCPTGEIQSLVKSSVNLTTEFQDETKLTRDYLNAFTKFWLTAADELLSEDSLPKVLRVPGGPALFCEIALSFASSPALLKRLSTIASAQELAAHVFSQIESSSDYGRMDRMIFALLATSASIDWLTDLARMVAIIRAPLSNHHALASALLVAGIQYSSAAGKKYLSDNLKVDQSLQNRLNEAIEKDLNIVEARALAIMVLLAQPFVLPDAVKDAEGERIVEQLDSSLKVFCGESEGAVTPLVAAVKGSPDLTYLAGRVMSRRVAAKDLGRLSSADAIDKIGAYLELLGTPDLKQAFVTELSTYGLFWDNMAKRPLENGVAQIFRKLIGDESTSAISRQKLKDRLVDLDASSWQGIILNGSATLDLALELHSLSPGLLELPNVFAALGANLDVLLNGTDPSAMVRWFNCTKLVSDDGRRTLFLNIRDRVTSGAPIASLVHLVQSGGNHLFDDGRFAEKADESVRHVLLPLVSTEGGIDALRSIKEVAKSWIDDSEASTRTVLLERLNNLEEGADEQGRNGCEELRSAWALPPLPIPDDEADTA